MACGYLVTVLVETIVLAAGLSGRHPLKRRLFAGVWLTACTYPVVWLVLPALLDLQTQLVLYLVLAETFVPAAECLLFWLAFDRHLPRERRSTIQDMATIVFANLASFVIGEVMTALALWDELIGWAVD